MGRKAKDKETGAEVTNTKGTEKNPDIPDTNPDFPDTYPAIQETNQDEQEIKIVKSERYICVKDCFSGDQYFEKKSNKYYTAREIPRDIIQNFKKITVQEIIKE